MVQINFAKREVQCKLVYYGPARSGKTANLRAIYERTPENIRGALTSIATDGDRTLFFDFLPLNLGQVTDIGTKINLYAVPYITNQNANRLLVLEGIDGIVFVADRGPDMMMENVEALENLQENLAELGREITDIPLVFQWNKSDLPDAIPLEELEAKLNPKGHPSFEATADAGPGVFPCLKAATQAVILNVSQMVAAQPAAAETTAAPRPEPAPRPAPAPKPAPAPTRAPAPAPERPARHIITPVHEDAVQPWQAEEIAEALTDEFEPPANEGPPQALSRADAEYQESFGQNPDAHSPATKDPPSVNVRATQALAQPGIYSQPPPVYSAPTPPRPITVPPPPAASGPRMVSVGGPAQPEAPLVQEIQTDGWDTARTAGHGAYHDRVTHPVIERRQRVRNADRKHVVPTANIVAGAICALVSLAALGYVVYALL